MTTRSVGIRRHLHISRILCLKSAFDLAHIPDAAGRIYLEYIEATDIILPMLCV